jgi:ribose transport system substrate-binding protein
MITSHRAHPVWLVGKAGFEKACSELGYTPKWEAANNGEMDVNLNFFEQAIAEKPAGIIIFPANEESFTPVIDKAADAGIPVITIHMDAPKSKRKAYIGPDTKVYAEAVADRIGKLLNGKGNVGIMQGSNYPHENQVAKYFQDRLEAKYPGIKVVAHDFDTTEVVKATQKATDMIQKHPEMNAVFSTTGGGCLSWSQAMDETNTTGKIIVISMDITRQNLDLVKSGKIYAVVGQGIYDEGYKGVHLAVEKNPKKINITDMPIITKDMVDKYYSQTGGK